MLQSNVCFSTAAMLFLESSRLNFILLIVFLTKRGHLPLDYICKIAILARQCIRLEKSARFSPIVSDKLIIIRMRILVL